MISFKVRKDEAETISAIAHRAIAMAHKHGIPYKAFEASMDITACHANGNPLRLLSLLDADDFNFSHDVFGIRRHINRETGKLENCFIPRFSARESAAA